MIFSILLTKVPTNFAAQAFTDFMGRRNSWKWIEPAQKFSLNHPRWSKNVLRKSQTLADHLQLLIEVSEPGVQNQLLVVSNKLLAFRLKLERAIVRFSNRNHGSSKSVPTEEKKEALVVQKTEEVKSVVVYTQTKGLIFALLLLEQWSAD